MISVPSIKPVLTKSPSADYYEGTIIDSSGTWRIRISTSTGFYKVEWWDGTTSTATNGNFALKSIVAPYNTAASKSFKVYSIDNITDQRKIGYITEIWHQRTNVGPLRISNINTANFRNCPRLQKFLFFNELGFLMNSPSSLDFSGLKELTDIRIGANSTGVYSGGAPNTTLTSVDVSGCSSLQYCYICNSNALTSITGLNSAANSLITLVVFNNPSLSSLRIQNCTFNGSYTYSYGGYNYLYSGGADIGFCAFDGAALDQIYTDLAAGNGFIIVKGNIGTPTDNPSIATAKGYTVLGT